MTAPAPGEARVLLARLTRALAAVATTALIFTMVNVTLFAVSRGIPWPIALLLDPMVALALATVLYADARLTAWGIRPPAWSTALRWFTGLAATLMNTWTSLWPHGHPGWPHHADPAAVFLHATPPLLLILLTETIAAYRRHLTHHLHPSAPPPHRHNPTTGPGQGTTGPGQGTTGPGQERAQPGAHADPPAGPGPLAPATSPDLDPPRCPPQPAPTPADHHTTPGHPPPGRAANGPAPAHTAPPTPPRSTPREPATDPGLFARAVELDTASRTLTGRPVSLRRLRTDLGIGTDRARRIHHQLRTRPTPGPDPEPPPAPGSGNDS